ncbi:addiction module antitoxin, RelB/DinJ family [Moraxella lacunata]|uniref:Addiction module antitoxin, RelB/DinJ family n=1 Tax=Moraxella lacunata TaxID=477 RepID=A0A378T5U0_MORLA|nr:type II toxin-antitoxin system RelB/DinJ family antitoxin [Moraxella lacunata]STZ55764.1 addiction module antitoxin, RelB/DinJ family [Moraxella lacunata]
MAQQSTVFQIRMNPQEKQEMFALFGAMGIKPSQAFRMFVNEVKRTGQMPFAPTLPNKETAEFLLLSDEQKGYEKVGKASDLLLDLDD